MTAAYPLSWPQNMPGAKAREKGQFRTSIARALDNVETSINAFGRDSGKAASGLVLSSNVTLGSTKPQDPGVAAWFVWDGLQVCIPIDRYQSVEANLQAIHHVIEARRVELRHGTLALVRATFTGFIALPSPSAKQSWRQVLGATPNGKLTVKDIDTLYRHAAKKAHPDVGGSNEAMAEIILAREEALREIG